MGAMSEMSEALSKKEPWWLKYAALLLTWIVAATVWVTTVPTTEDVRREAKAIAFTESNKDRDALSVQLTTISIQLASIQTSQTEQKARLDRLEKRINDFLDGRMNQ